VNIKPLYGKYQHTASALRKKQANEQEWAQRLDMLQFQVQEIQSANLHPDEETTLTAERDRLANFQRISTALNASAAVAQR
jgi:DNA repair protein RecN (Recombination protein N)